MRLGRAVDQVASRPIGVRMETLRGAPTLIAGASITPVARRLALWWPGGAWAYAWPIAIEYPEGERIRRERIPNMRMRASAAFAALGLVSFAIFVARRPR